ncbi:PhoX family protein [Leptolyngbya sp. AN02str]|uniref:PhoX family protein n=1 Tax=Leptolyngbya sp. AN02str TaxID=3423363 RepID=UPI003D310B6C
MTLKRRHFLMFLGASAGSVALQSFVPSGGRSLSNTLTLKGNPAFAQGVLPFTPIKGAMPIETDGVALTKQVEEYSRFAVVDDVVVPEGFTYDVVAAWGDPVGDSRFGYNNDYLSFVETAPGEGYLTVNFEYISPLPWNQTFEEVVGKALPVDAVLAAAEASGDEGINAFALADGDAVKTQVMDYCKEAMIDVGIGVISVRREADGRWVRTFSNRDRRITGLSGFEDGRYLKTTGPATAVFRKRSGQGYLDGLGDRAIGTFNNCSGGTTPWGTILSGEENFQDFVPETVYADGTSLNPSNKTFNLSSEGIDGLGNVFGLAGNKYGWAVEVDPANPNDFGTKHSWLGRYRHEGFGIRAEANKPLVVYAGCDRRGGHIYKFVSNGIVRNPQSKSNSRLLEDGMLYAAKLNADGTGRWIALEANTPVDPELPSVHIGGMITLPNRPDGGISKVTDDGAIATYKTQFKTLGDLYEGNAAEQQGAILIDAHFAANAAGATCTARPEDTDLGADGTLYIAFTSGAPSGSDGSPNKDIFKAPTGEAQWEYGWIVKLMEDSNDPTAMTFRWESFSLGGEPADGGSGFANPDNLEFDANGNLWMVTDMSTDKHNKEIASRVKEDGSAVSQSDLRGLYGNNSVWYLPTSGPNAGEAYLFAYGPMDAEMTGPFMTKDMRTLFLAAQHPGEIGGTRNAMQAEVRKFALRTTDGQEFMQERTVPIGSNWPGGQPNDPPKPSVVAIRRLSGAPLV